MKNSTIIFSLILFVAVSAQVAFTQQPNKPTDLLAGKVQKNGLPEGWDTVGENLDCTIKFDENKAIYFERQSPGEKCSFFFTKNVPNGVYLLKTNFKFDGNGAEVLLDGKPLKKQQTVNVTDGKLHVGIQTKGGKAWGWIRKMSVVQTKAK